MCELNISQIYN